MVVSSGNARRRRTLRSGRRLKNSRSESDARSHAAIISAVGAIGCAPRRRYQMARAMLAWSTLVGRRGINVWRPGRARAAASGLLDGTLGSALQPRQRAVSPRLPVRVVQLEY